MGRPMPARSNRFKYTTALPRLPYFPHISRHPAPLPRVPTYPPNPELKASPAKPFLKVSKSDSGIILAWNIPGLNSSFADISSYEIFSYTESPGPATSDLWRNVGNVRALPLPIACTLTRFREGHRYHFSVRAMDCHGRCGPFSRPVSVLYTRM